MASTASSLVAVVGLILVAVAATAGLPDSDATQNGLDVRTRDRRSASGHETVQHDPAVTMVHACMTFFFIYWDQWYRSLQVFATGR
jgi:hypothetical protein